MTIIPDRERLIELAGERVFQRGAEYFTWRRVRKVAVQAGTARALVEGNRCYQVFLRIDDREILSDCDCPEGEAGRFCKHCVAVCLALSEAEQGRELVGVVNLSDVRGYLTELPNAELVELLIDESLRNEGLRERLLLRTAQACDKKPDLEAHRYFLQSAVFAVVSDDGEEPSWVMLNNIESSLSKLLNYGFAAEVAALVEEMLPFIFSFQDQNSACRELAVCLLSFHRRSSINSENLAQRLFEWQMSRGTEEGDGIVRSCFDLLGSREMSSFEQLIESKWNDCKSQDSSAGWEDRVKYARLARLMESLAKRRGDVSSLIQIKSQRLDSAADYLEIARLCQKTGDGDQALQWALRGKNLFEVSAAAALYEFIGEEYEAREDWRGALEINFALFSESPSLKIYQRMALIARRIGEWEEWRQRALFAVRRGLVEPPLSTSRRSRQKIKPNQSLLVRILLWEGHEEAAWKAAQEGNCDEELLSDLAVRRAKSHPEDAIRIYQNLVTRNVSRKNNYAYRRVIELLRQIGRLMRKQNRRDEFIDYVEGLRRTYRAQRNFVAQVDSMVARSDRRRRG